MDISQAPGFFGERFNFMNTATTKNTVGGARLLEISALRFWSGVWALVLVAYSIVALIYLVHVAREDLGIAVLYSLALVIELGILFLAEGVEMSVNILLDKDPEQIPDSCRDTFEGLIQNNGAHDRNPEKLFMSGRQLLVAIAAVMLTFTCEGLSKHWNPSHYPWIRDVFKYGFPVIAILWFAQLVPKYLARANPVTTYAWWFSRAVIRLSIAIERIVYIGAPSDWMVQRLSPFIKGIGNELRTSRESYYRTSATLRDGKGLEKRQIDITIRGDGSVSVTESFWFKAFATGFRRVAHKVRWESKILPSAGGRIKFIEELENLPAPSTPVAKSAGPEQVGGLEFYSAEWECTFAQDIPIGTSFAFEIKYETERGATVVSGSPAKDYYAYNVTQIPTKLLEVSVRAAADAEFALVDAWKEINPTSTDVANEDLNAKERERIKIKYDRGCYTYSVRYPLPSTNFRFWWKLGDPPAPFNRP